MTYGDPEIDNLYDEAREYVVANMLDGSDDGGLVTMRAKVLADEVGELMAAFAVRYKRRIARQIMADYQEKFLR